MRPKRRLQRKNGSGSTVQPTFIELFRLVVLGLQRGDARLRAGGETQKQEKNPVRDQTPFRLVTGPGKRTGKDMNSM